eukprot:1635023-Amphidinium_carterae.1
MAVWRCSLIESLELSLFPWSLISAAALTSWRGITMTKLQMHARQLHWKGWTGVSLASGAAIGRKRLLSGTTRRVVTTITALARQQRLQVSRTTTKTAAAASESHHNAVSAPTCVDAYTHTSSSLVSREQQHHRQVQH